MSTLKVDEILDSSGGSNAVLYGPASPAGSMGFRNRIINGDMRIDQRNAGASVTPASGAVTYTVDRWKFYVTQASKLTVQQNAGSVTPPAGFTNYLGTTSSSAYSVGSGDLFVQYQAIEGFNCADFAWGTASAKTITISFWVRSSLTGTHSGALQNSANNRSYAFTFTVNSANTWEQKTITVAGDQSGTWLTNNGIGLSIYFNLGAGSTYSTTAGSWQAGNFTAVTGSVSVVGTNGATFYITGVQLEVGSVATEFERRPYGTELALCQRYFQSIGGTVQYTRFAWGQAYSGSRAQVITPLKVTMRTSPSLNVVGSTYAPNSTASNLAVTAYAIDSADPNNVVTDITVSSGFTAGYATQWISLNNTTTFVQYSAEL